MAITPKQLDIEGAYIEDAYMALEQELIEMLIKRLNASTLTELTEDTVFQWQIEKMQQLSMMNYDTINELVSQTSKYTEEQLKKLITETGYKVGIEADEEFSKLMNTNIKPNNLDQVLNQYFKSQWLELDNHVNQTLITTNYKDNPLAKMYQQVLNDTVSKVLTGFQTPQKAFRSSIYEMVDKGVMSSFTDVSGREWSLERYVRMVIKATTHRVYNDLRIERGNDYGIVTALMSSHAAARKACAHIQGGWVLTVRTEEAPEEFQHIPSIYDFGYGKPEGTQGIHCGHILYPAVPGINTNNMPKPPSPQEAMANAELVAKQRRLEVSIRQAKKSLNAAETMGADEDIAHFKQLIRRRQASLRQFISDNDELLHRDYGREAVYS
ncbi:phage minor capsid protein [Vagococcus fluvialis]|uniref:Phage capsid protein n=1 Tax=Vagococcus fluvialis TaxID=2738 RepID=A0A7X6D7M2_9ENTE|nr:phage minor capsid protein [Vagococcus fluvialis]NKC67190.1 phage capsid protein [Vagococcus fluvialis]